MHCNFKIIIYNQSVKQSLQFFFRYNGGYSDIYVYNGNLNEFSGEKKLQKFKFLLNHPLPENLTWGNPIIDTNKFQTIKHIT